MYVCLTDKETSVNIAPGKHYLKVNLDYQHYLIPLITQS